MDAERFDRMVRRLGRERSRRQALRGMGAAALGILGVARARTVDVGAQIIVCPVCQTPDSAGTDCVADPTQNGVACNEGNACTRTDTCQNGKCVGGNPITCAPLDQCHDAGICNPNTGRCTDPVKPNGAACDAGNACTTGDTCQTGSCVAGEAVVCPVPDACHVAGSCDAASGGCTAPKRTANPCASGRVKGVACDCDGTCCSAGRNCVGTPGQRRCQ
jgi:hypothetical protein